MIAYLVMSDESIQYIIQQLDKNKLLFEKTLDIDSEKVFLWKPSADKWCLLEIVCHLIDEEIKDFRRRVKHTLETPNDAAPPIDPAGWVTSRKYIERDYNTSVSKLLVERNKSITWLKSIKDGQWYNEYKHAQIGNISAKQFLANWLAHDYLHIRQIMKLKFQYLEYLSEQDLRYAGEL